MCANLRANRKKFQRLEESRESTTNNCANFCIAYNRLSACIKQVQLQSRILQVGEKRERKIHATDLKRRRDTRFALCSPAGECVMHKNCYKRRANEAFSRWHLVKSKLNGFNVKEVVGPFSGYRHKLRERKILLIRHRRLSKSKWKLRLMRT